VSESVDVCQLQRGEIMTGSIRAFVGFMMVFGAAGGVDSATDAQLVQLIVVAVVGLAVMASGVFAMKGNV
jgi:hypothetical protein